MTRHKLFTATLTAMVITLFGCPPPPPQIVGPIVANGQVVFLNQAAPPSVLIVNPATLGKQQVLVQPYPQAVGVLPNAVLISGGDGADPVVDMVAVPGGKVQSLKVPGVYQNVSTSPDSNFAILYFNPSATPVPGSPAAQNNNQITVIDVPAFSATTLSLNTASLAPENILYSPDNTLAAIVLDGTVVLMQLADPSAQVQVPLTLPDGTTLHPTRALFSPDSAFLYIQATGVDDIITLSITSTPGSISTAVNFLILPGASGLLDILVPSGSDFTHSVAALYESGSIALLDATGDTSITKSESATGAQIDDLGNGILLVSGANATTFSAWEPLLDRATSGTLPSEALGFPIISDNHALYMYAPVSTGGSESAQLTTASLTDTGSELALHESPITLSGAPAAGTVDPVSGTVFFSLPTSNPSTCAIVTLVPDTLAIGGFTAVDSPFDYMGVAGNFVFGYHDTQYGDIAFIRIANPTSVRNIPKLF